MSDGLKPHIFLGLLQERTRMAPKNREAIRQFRIGRRPAIMCRPTRAPALPAMDRRC